MRAPHHEAAFVPDGGSKAIPLRGIVLALAGMVVVGALCTVAVIKDEASTKKEKATHCAEVPPAVLSKLRGGLSLTGGRRVRAWSASRAGADAAPRAGAWFVSIEMATPELAARTTGDIATWVVPDADGAPSTGQLEAVDHNAERFSTWPAAPQLDINASGLVESRWCAKDADPEAGS
jgi:hypothetical protein